MATLISLKRRIRAAQNVSKTTKAMQMIAASKLKKAQEATLSSRPYVEKLSSLVIDAAAKIENKSAVNYLRDTNTTGKTLILAVSPDKGLCGGLVTNLLREFFNLSGEYKNNAEYVVVGKKLEGQITKLPNEVIASFQFGSSLPGFEMVIPIITIVNDYYLGEKVDKVKLLYTDFTSVFSQTPKVIDLLPVILPQDIDRSQVDKPALFEPNAMTLLPELLKHYVEMRVYQAMLESFVSEQASRMIAMQNATDNAKEIISGLKLEYNKTRQAKITSELLDITSGRRQGESI